MNYLRFPLIYLLILLLVTACSGEESLPTIVPAVSAILPSPTLSPSPTLLPTWTVSATEIHREASEISIAETATARPTRTPRPTIIIPTKTPRPTTTNTPAPTIVLIPTFVPPPPVGQTPPPGGPTAIPADPALNFLPNASFENGWYHPNGIPELQIPKQWTFTWEEGSNSLDPDPWNQWVRPEARVIPSPFLSEEDQLTYIWDGDHTVKIFKNHGAISFQLSTEMYLEPGTYILLTHIYPDLVESYTDEGDKIWASDELSGEVSFIVDGQQTAWKLPSFGRRNQMGHTFEVTNAHSVQIVVAVRGRWALDNNAWFMDDWSLSRKE